MKNLRINIRNGYLLIDQTAIAADIMRLKAMSQGRLESDKGKRDRKKLLLHLRKQQKQYEKLAAQLFKVMFQRPRHIEVPVGINEKLKQSFHEMHVRFVDRIQFVAESMDAQIKEEFDIPFVKILQKFNKRKTNSVGAFQSILRQFLVVYPKNLPEAGAKQTFDWKVNSITSAKNDCLRYLTKNLKVDLREFGFTGTTNQNVNALRMKLERAANEEREVLQYELETYQKWSEEDSF